MESSISQKEKMVINNREVTFTPGQTILEAAAANQIHIPTLCYMKDVLPIESCRVCVVEVEGFESLVPSCATPAKAGICVQTESKKVVAARKEIIALLLASGNHNCAVAETGDRDWTALQLQVQQDDHSAELCPAWGDCRLQDLAYHYQVTTSGVPRASSPYPMETENPLIIRDFSRCILCGRCVKACREVQVNNAIQFGYTSDYTKITTVNDVPLKDSNCVFCGECVQACPVGALVEKKARYQYRPWKAQKIRTTCPYCGVGCQLWLHVVDGRIVRVTGVEDAAPNKGRLCVKGRFGYDFIYSEERLKNPLIRNDDGSFREATWDEALGLVADRFKQIIREHGPDALAGVSCARSINEDSYQMMKFFRAVIGTNNIDHCART